MLWNYPVHRNDEMFIKLLLKCVGFASLVFAGRQLLVDTLGVTRIPEKTGRASCAVFREN